MEKKDLIGKVVSYRFGRGWKFKNFLVNKDLTLTYLGNGNDGLEESKLPIESLGRLSKRSQAFANDVNKLVELNFIDCCGYSNLFYFNLGSNDSEALTAACKAQSKGFRK